MGLTFRVTLHGDFLPRNPEKFFLREMFNPEMLAAAQKMMQNMSPEQLAQIAGMASKMNPEILKNMPGGNAGMPIPTPEQMKEAQEKLKKMSSSEMKDVFANASRVMTGQNTYIVNGATTLKNEGNEKVRAGDYAGGVELFKKALDNLNGVPTPDESVKSVSQSIRLNLALCYLKLKEYDNCVSVCDEVLSLDNRSIKALYRRGVARRELGQILAGATDLKLSMLLAEQKDEVINSEYEKSLQLVIEASDLEKLDGVSLADLETEVPEVPQISNLKKAKEIIETNPDVINRMGDVISQLDDKELDGLLTMTAGGNENAPDLASMKDILKNKDFMKSMSDMMKNMDPSVLNQMTGATSAGTSSSSSSDMAGMMNDPNMLNSVMSMIDTVPDEVLEDMLAKQGVKAPGFLTGSRMKWIARQVMVLMRIWIFIKRVFAIILSRNGKIILAIVAITFGLYIQYGNLLISGPTKEEEKDKRADL
jgi:tetratricopeptide (TPR) repeat protein